MTNLDAVMKENTNDLFSQLLKEFAGLTIDIEEISKHCSDPFFIALLLFQLAKERERTNKLLEEINKKLSAQQQTSSLPLSAQAEQIILSETDQRIIALAEQKGMINAQDVKELLAYNCINAASQRLNKLFREGHLAKVRSGKKVFFVVKKTSLLPTPNHPQKQSPL